MILIGLKMSYPTGDWTHPRVTYDFLVALLINALFRGDRAYHFEHMTRSHNKMQIVAVKPTVFPAINQQTIFAFGRMFALQEN